jgi:hypothetical protein
MASTLPRSIAWRLFEEAYAITARRPSQAIVNGSQLARHRCRSETYTEAIYRRKRGGGPTVPANQLETKSFEREELHRLVNEDGHNRSIPRDELRRARLRKGVLNNRLAAELVDGSHVKLLWLKADPGFDVLRAALAEWLRDDLEVR